MKAPQRIVVAYDFSLPAWRALELAGALRSRLGCEVHVVHVIPETFPGMEHLPPDSGWAAPEQLDRYAKDKREEVRQAIKTVFSEDAGSTEAHVLRGPPAKTLLREAQQLEADLVIVGSTGKSGIERALLGSVADTLLRRSEAPVLTVH